MILSTEITKILREKRKKTSRNIGSFDSAITNLGVGVLTQKKKEQSKKTKN